jgi:hypothetical protein
VALAYPLLGILGLVLHIWSIVIGYKASGVGAAVLTATFPVLSEIYWARRIWNATGTFANDYTVAVALYFVLFAVTSVGFHLMEVDAG